MPTRPNPLFQRLTNDLRRRAFGRRVLLSYASVLLTRGRPQRIRISGVLCTNGGCNADGFTNRSNRSLFVIGRNFENCEKGICIQRGIDGLYSRLFSPSSRFSPLVFEGEIVARRF